MSQKEHFITLVCSPFQPALEIAGNLPIKLHVPYSDKDVTIRIGADIVDYKEAPQANMRQVMASRSTGDTQTLSFDFFKNKIQKINFDNKKYEIELIDIGKKNEKGQDFPSFAFKITEIERLKC